MADLAEQPKWSPCARCTTHDYCTNQLRGCDISEALEAGIAPFAHGVAGNVNPACGVHGPIPCEGAGCTCGVAPTAPTPRPATVAEAQHAAEIGACLPNGVLFDAFGNPRTRYTRVIADGSTCVCDDVQVREWREDEARTPGTYVFQDVYLSKEEFDGLPEFDGF